MENERVQIHKIRGFREVQVDVKWHAAVFTGGSEILGEIARDLHAISEHLRPVEEIIPRDGLSGRGRLAADLDAQGRFAADLQAFLSEAGSGYGRMEHDLLALAVTAAAGPSDSLRAFYSLLEPDSPSADVAALHEHWFSSLSPMIPDLPAPIPSLPGESFSGTGGILPIWLDELAKRRRLGGDDACRF